MISRVSEDDLGYYTCVASNPAGTKEVTIFVKVVTPPEIADSEDTETQEVHIGSSFSLYCPVFSTPTPEVCTLSDSYEGGVLAIVIRFHKTLA